MKIKLLHAVMHDGYRVEAGEVGDIDEAIAKPLIASGAAEEVAANEPMAKPIDLPKLFLAAEADADGSAPATTAAPAGEVGTAAGTPQATPETPPAENAEVASAEASPAAPVAEDTPAEASPAAPVAEDTPAEASPAAPVAEDTPAEAGKTKKGSK